jgi:hypothetical protein
VWGDGIGSLCCKIFITEIKEKEQRYISTHRSPEYERFRVLRVLISKLNRRMDWYGSRQSDSIPFTKLQLHLCNRESFPFDLDHQRYEAPQQL